MTREQLLAEKRFLACLRLLHRLREEGRRSAAEYAQARSPLQDDSQPARAAQTEAPPHKT